MKERTHIISINGENKEVPLYIEKRHCDFCNKDFEHNGYERDVKIHFHNKSENNYMQCCGSCFEKNRSFSDDIKFVNYIPTFCDGGTYRHEIFETVDDLICFLNDRYITATSENILCCDKDCIVIVSNRTWYVAGYTSVNMSDYLPYWKDVVETLK